MAIDSSEIGLYIHTIGKDKNTVETVPFGDSQLKIETTPKHVVTISTPFEKDWLKVVQLEPTTDAWYGPNATTNVSILDAMGRPSQIGIMEQDSQTMAISLVTSVSKKDDNSYVQLLAHNGLVRLGLLIPEKNIVVPSSARNLMRENQSTLLWKKVATYDMPSMPLAHTQEVRSAGEIAIAKEVIKMKNMYNFYPTNASV